MKEDDKITRFGPRKTKTTIYSNKNKIAEVKEYLGFEYVKLKKDVNGIRFSKSSLLEYKQSVKYRITVMREINKTTYLYEYFIPDSQLKNFLTAHFDGKIEGEIIQIEKYNQDFPA